MTARVGSRWSSLFLIGLVIAGCGSDPGAPPPAPALDTAAPDARDAAGNPESAPGLDTAGTTDLVTAMDGTPPADAGAGPDGGDATALGTDGAAGPAALARYLGVWTYLFGTEKLQCQGRPDTMGDLTGATLTMTMGTAGAALQMASGTCLVRFGVSGDVATALPGQTCTSSQDGATLTYLVDSFTFTLEGAAAKEASTWTITFTQPQGIRRCTLVTSGNLDRS